MNVILRLLFLGSLFAGCSSMSSPPDPIWREIEVEIPSDRVLWKMVLLAAESNGYPLTGALDPSSGEVLTGWKTNLQPFSGRGTRTRAEIELDPVGPGRWVVRAHVQKQRNMALVNPLDPTRAEWEWADDDPILTQVLLRHLRAALPVEFDVEAARSVETPRGGV